MTENEKTLKYLESVCDSLQSGLQEMFSYAIGESQKAGIDKHSAARLFATAALGPVLGNMLVAKRILCPTDQQVQALVDNITALVDRLATSSRLPESMEDMTEPELAQHLRIQLQFIKQCQTSDTLGSMLVIFQRNGITQYGATVDPETAPQALRELADRIESRQTVKRDEEL